MNMKKIIGTLLISAPMIVSAVPAFKGKMKMMQDDGSTFNAQIKGDEWFHWVEDSDGNALVFNKESNNYEYGMIEKINGMPTLVASGEAVSEKSSKSGAQRSSAVKRVSKKDLQEIWKLQKAQKHYTPKK